MVKLSTVKNSWILNILVTYEPEIQFTYYITGENVENLRC